MTLIRNTEAKPFLNYYIYIGQVKLFPKFLENFNGEEIDLNLFRLYDIFPMI